jgi:radical SAM superfamily enzyme YgiQ (UPF0313 family)
MTEYPPKAHVKDRMDLIKKAACGISGTYAPSLYETEEINGWTVIKKPIASEIPFPIHARRIADMDKALSPIKPVVPVSAAVQERSVVEVMRGCPNGCRFCQAGFVTRPARNRSPENAAEILLQCLANTGYDEAGLLSLSASDYPYLQDCAERLDKVLAPKRISLSLGSLRADKSLPMIAKALRTVRSGGMTIAPEAGSDRLREVVNKNITEEDLLEGAQAAFDAGISHVKLYFMLGLPTETDEDVLAIADLSRKIALMHKKGGKPSVGVSCSNFVPKPHTPFQWEAGLPTEEFMRRQKILSQSIDRKRITFAMHDAKTSRLEAVFSRGDRKLARAAESAYQKGARMDCWTERFQWNIWEEAFRETGLDAERYAGAREKEDILPWNHIAIGVSFEYLKREWEKSFHEERTAACTFNGCVKCGACR